MERIQLILYGPAQTGMSTHNAVQRALRSDVTHLHRGAMVIQNSAWLDAMREKLMERLEASNQEIREGWDDPEYVLD